MILEPLLFAVRAAFTLRPVLLVLIWVMLQASLCLSFVEQATLAATCLQVLSEVQYLL